MRRHAHIIAIALILSICCCIFTACGKSATPSDTPSTTQPSGSTTESTQPSELTQHSEPTIKIYVPESLETYQTSVNVYDDGPWTVYLMGVKNPEPIKVLGWTLIEQKTIDDGLVKLVVNNTEPGPNQSTLRTITGEILVDEEVIEIHDTSAK